jgi:hypothetical protein
MSLFITRIGHQAIKAKNSHEALTFAETEKPDLIFMDMDLPEVRPNLPVAQIGLEVGYPHYERQSHVLSALVFSMLRPGEGLLSRVLTCLFLPLP